MLRIAIVDDETDACDHLARLVARYAAAHAQPIEAATHTSANAFLANLEFADAAPDIVFLDIEMPGLDGMQAAHTLRDKGFDGQIVFVTNMAQFAIRGYEVGALDFIVKPVDYPTFEFKFARVAQAAQRRQDAFVVLDTKGGFLRLRLADLIYVEVSDHKLIYHTTTGNVELWGTIKAAAADLEPRGFAFCNACYLVNLDKVTGLDGDFVRLGDVSLKVSRGKSRAFLDALARSVGR